MEHRLRQRVPGIRVTKPDHCRSGFTRGGRRHVQLQHIERVRLNVGARQHLRQRPVPVGVYRVLEPQKERGAFRRAERAAAGRAARHAAKSPGRQVGRLETRVLDGYWRSQGLRPEQAYANQNTRHRDRSLTAVLAPNPLVSAASVRPHRMPPSPQPLPSYHTPCI